MYAIPFLMGIILPPAVISYGGPYWSLVYFAIVVSGAFIFFKNGRSKGKPWTRILALAIILGTIGQCLFFVNFVSSFLKIEEEKGENK